MADIISFDREVLPRTVGAPLEEGQYQTVHFTLNPNLSPLILGKLEQWFEGRDEISLIGEGRTATGLGFVTLEWAGVEIDPLFIKILEHDESVEDFSIYIRED